MNSLKELSLRREFSKQLAKRKSSMEICIQNQELPHRRGKEVTAAAVQHPVRSPFPPPPSSPSSAGTAAMAASCDLLDVDPPELQFPCKLPTPLAPQVPRAAFLSLQINFLLN